MMQIIVYIFFLDTSSRIFILNYGQINSEFIFHVIFISDAKKINYLFFINISLRILIKKNEKPKPVVCKFLIKIILVNGVQFIPIHAINDKKDSEIIYLFIKAIRKIVGS